MEINKILNYAKLDVNDLNSNIQRVYFSDELDNDEMKLMELDEYLADKLRSGEK